VIRLGFSRQSQISAARIAEASGGEIVAVRSSDCDVNWGRRSAPGALNADISASVNKRLMRERFDESRVPSPQLYDATDARVGLNEGDIAGGALVGRPDFHTRRRGFWYCDDLDDLDRALRGTRRKQPPTHFIRYVSPEEAPKEFRAHVFRGNSIRISEKRFDPEDRRKYTTARPDPDLPKRYLRKAAKAAVAAVGLDFGAVDILASEDQTQVWVLEVNAAPGLGGSMPRLWAQTLIEHFREEET
jgi:hypothetical protein